MGHSESWSGNKAGEVTGADYEAEALHFILQEVRSHQGFVKDNDACVGMKKKTQTGRQNRGR